MPKKILLPILIMTVFFISACVYIVLPDEIESSDDAASENVGWTGIVTNVGESETGDLHIDLAIRNDTRVWSTMRAEENKPAVLKTSDGKSINCETVFISTGGHRLAPGFQIRGYTTEENNQTVTQLIYVECGSVVAAPGSKLLIDYIRFDGDLDYYVEVEEENKVEGQLELNLDEVVTDLTYPVGTPIEGLVQDTGIEITALSDNVVRLLDVQRSDAGFQFTWENYNPSKFALKTHIGIPPVVGEDGIIYGVYKTLDIPEVPLTPAGGNVEWITEVAIPEDVSGLYILLSVESKKPRTYVNYAIALTDQ